MVIFEMAHNLGMPVYQMLDEMSYKEFQGWFKYYKLRPPEWRHDQRTAMLCQAMGSKAKSEELFPSLKAIFDDSRVKERMEKKKIAANPFISRMRAQNEGLFDFLEE